MLNIIVMLLSFINVTKYLLIFILQTISLLSCYLCTKSIQTLSQVFSFCFQFFEGAMYVGRIASPVKIMMFSQTNRSHGVFEGPNLHLCYSCWFLHLCRQQRTHSNKLDNLDTVLLRCNLCDSSKRWYLTAICLLWYMAYIICPVHESLMTFDKHFSTRYWSMVEKKRIDFNDRITSSWPCWIRSGPVRNSISFSIVFKPSFWAPVSSPCCRNEISCLLMNWERVSV